MKDDKFLENCKLWGCEVATREKTDKRNNSREVFRKIAWLKVRGVDIAQALLDMGIDRVYIYGAGEIGTLLLTELQGKIKIVSIIDSNRELSAKSMEGINIITPDALAHDAVPIIITPAAYIQEITFGLLRKGIDRQRMISLNILLDFLMQDAKMPKPLWNNARHQLGYQFLITGAEFRNKGSQAMLFTAISEIRKIYSNAIIWYLPIDNWAYSYAPVIDKYKIFFLLDGSDLHSKTFEILPNITAIIDIGGYALSSYREKPRPIHYLRIAYNYKIPMYLMPQSYGPLDFEKELQDEIKKMLHFAKVVYAREKWGYDLLVKTYGLKNIRMSKDMVLQNKEIDYSSLYIQTPNLRKYTLQTVDNVGIIPNIRSYEFSQQDKILAIYREVIEKLLCLGKNVYILMHSNDNQICGDIYDIFKERNDVHLWTEELDCIEFGAFVSNFQYVIAARYHAIVHAYKRFIPCVAIGWAEKYNELLALFEQEKYVFDVREDINVQNIVAAVERMNESYVEEKKKIEKILPTLQKENCFDILSQLVVKD